MKIARSTGFLTRLWTSRLEMLNMRFSRREKLLSFASCEKPLRGLFSFLRISILYGVLQVCQRHHSFSQWDSGYNKFLQNLYKFFDCQWCTALSFSVQFLQRWKKTVNTSWSVGNIRNGTIFGAVMPTSQTELSEAILLLLNTIKQMLMYGTVSVTDLQNHIA